MTTIKVRNLDEVSRNTAEIIVELVKKKKNSTIGFATGSTPLGTYERLVKEYQSRTVDFSDITSFNLDEYYPIKKSNENSYYHYMFENLFNHINIRRENIHLLDGEATDPQVEVVRYEEEIQQHPIDLQILGIGENDHIAFNEPFTPFNSRTHVVELSQSTREANARFFDSIHAVPSHALTMGLWTIMKARTIILLASGKSKAHAVQELMKGTVMENCPACLLHNHPDVTLIVDEDATELMSEKSIAGGRFIQLLSRLFRSDACRDCESGIMES